MSQSPVQKIDQLKLAQLEDLSFHNFPQFHGVYFMYEEDDNLLYIGKSKNLRIRQHFKNFNGTKRDLTLKQKVKRVEFIQTFYDLATDLHNRASRASRFQYGLLLVEYKDNLRLNDY